MAEDWKLNEQVARELLGNSDTPASIIHLILLKAYGVEVIYGDEDSPPMDPIILWNTAEEDFRITIPPENENKMNAMMTACATNEFFISPEIFAAICVSLSTGDLGDFINGEFDPPTSYEMMQAITEVDLNDGDRDARFNPDVKNLIMTILNGEGLDPEEMEETYEDEIDFFVNQLLDMYRALGVPEHLIKLPEDSTLYGLLE